MAAMRKVVGSMLQVGAISLTVQDSSVTSNSAGPGGAPGSGGEHEAAKAGLGGNAQGGGIFTSANSLILNSTVAYNTAVGNDIATTAQGGGVFVSPVPVGSVAAPRSITQQLLSITATHRVEASTTRHSHSDQHTGGG